MERFDGRRFGSEDMFVDSCENINVDDEDMFDVEEDADLVRALEETGQFENEMEFEEEEVGSCSVSVSVYYSLLAPGLSISPCSHSLGDSPWV